MASSGLIEVFTPGTTTLKDRKEREVLPPSLSSHICSISFCVFI